MGRPPMTVMKSWVSWVSPLSPKSWVSWVSPGCPGCPLGVPFVPPVPFKVWMSPFDSTNLQNNACSTALENEVPLKLNCYDVNGTLITSIVLYYEIVNVSRLSHDGI